VSEKLAFLASETKDAQEALEKLVSIYGNCKPQEAMAIIALGGDGFMLQTQHEYMNSGLPIYGMNKGTVGFLMNEYKPDNLRQRVSRALKSKIRPLSMVATDMNGKTHKAVAKDWKRLFVMVYWSQLLRALQLTTYRRTAQSYRLALHFWR